MRKLFDWDADQIKPGDRVRLRWYGDKAIPMRLGDTEAVILSFHVKRWKVRADQDAYGTRSVDTRHISAVWRDGEWVYLREYHSQELKR